MQQKGLTLQVQALECDLLKVISITPMSTNPQARETKSHNPYSNLNAPLPNGCLGHNAAMLVMWLVGGLRTLLKFRYLPFVSMGKPQ